MITVSFQYPTALRMPSKLGFEKVAMSAVGSFAELMGFTAERIEDLKSAVAEACINAMEHGNRFAEEADVELQLFMDEEQLEVHIHDRGAGPRARQTVAPDMAKKMAGEETARGMGLFLIQHLVDEAGWVENDGDGGYMRLVLRLNETDKERT
jgi:serine/threonine-protein kinase RsbW